MKPLQVFCYIKTLLLIFHYHFEKQNVNLFLGLYLGKYFFCIKLTNADKKRKIPVLVKNIGISIGYKLKLSSLPHFQKNCLTFATQSSLNWPV